MEPIKVNNSVMTAAKLCFLLVVALASSGCDGSAENSSANRENADTPTDTVTAAAGQMADVKADTDQPATVTDARDLSVISISLDPPLEFIVTDPQGRRTGHDLNSGQSHSDIPNSAYYGEYIEDPDGEGGVGTKDLEIRSPADGEYRLSVTGSSVGTYSLYIRLYDAGGSSKGFDTENIAIDSAQEHLYALKYNSEDVSLGTFTAISEK